MRRIVFALIMLLTTVVVPVINPDNAAPSGWFTPVMVSE